MSENETDVLVVGAGPTGLLTAAELALHGIAVQVVDRLTEPDQTVKAGSINVATAEVLDRRGLLPAAREAQQRMMSEVLRFSQSTRQPAPDSGRPRPAFPVNGHFAGMLFQPDLLDEGDPELHAHAAVADATLVRQADMEALLAEHVTNLGVPIRRGVEVTGMHDHTADDHNDDADHDNGSGVTLETSAGQLTARWVVGADGGRSVIRHLAGIDFPGTDPETTGYQAIADIDGADQLGRGWSWTPTGVYCNGPIPGRILTVQFTGTPADRSAPVTREELQASIRLVSGKDVTVTAIHGTATRWTDNARQASTYRRGHVLLTGDAAHVHSPFSGQGLNLGIGDAANLGWKLAATIQGWAPDGLLDTYTAERHPIGAWVLDWTRAQVALMRGDEKTRQLRAVVQQQLLSMPATMTRLVKLTSGVAQHYALNGGAETTTVDDRHAPNTVGRLVGDVELADGSRLADHAHAGRFVLLDRTGVNGTVRPWPDRVVVVTDHGNGPGMLIRPDGVIVWISDSESSEDLERLRQALRRWAGISEATT